MSEKKKIFFIFGFVCLLIGCAHNISPNTYRTAEVGTVSHVKKGIIISKRVVQIDNNSGAGGLAGMTAGGAAGSMVGDRTATNVVGSVGGMAVGGLIGSFVDKTIHHAVGYEYIIKLKSGNIISVTQTKDIQFKLNQRVLVVYGVMTRLIPDTTAQKVG